LAVVAPIFLFVEAKMEYKTLVITISYSNLNTKMVSLNLNTNVANNNIFKGAI
jgi:hypothetical protein